MANRTNSRIGKKWKKKKSGLVAVECKPDSLCYPVNHFDMVEICKKCKKTI